MRIRTFILIILIIPSIISSKSIIDTTDCKNILLGVYYSSFDNQDPGKSIHYKVQTETNKKNTIDTIVDYFDVYFNSYISVLVSHDYEIYQDSMNVYTVLLKEKVIFMNSLKGLKKITNSFILNKNSLDSLINNIIIRNCYFKDNFYVVEFVAKNKSKSNKDLIYKYFIDDKKHKLISIEVIFPNSSEIKFQKSTILKEEDNLSFDFKKSLSDFIFGNDRFKDYEIINSNRETDY